MDRAKVARDVRDVTPDWYVVRDGDGRVRTLISCDPWKYMPDDLLMESGKPMRSSGDRVAMCQHSTVDAANGLAVEMSYARVLLDDCWRLEATTRETMRRHKVGSTRQEYSGPRHVDADADDPKSGCIAHDQHDIPRGFGPG